MVPSSRSAATGCGGHPSSRTAWPVLDSVRHDRRVRSAHDDDDQLRRRPGRVRPARARRPHRRAGGVAAAGVDAGVAGGAGAAARGAADAAGRGRHRRGRQPVGGAARGQRRHARRRQPPRQRAQGRLARRRAGRDGRASSCCGRSPPRDAAGHGGPRRLGRRGGRPLRPQPVRLRRRRWARSTSTSCAASPTGTATRCPTVLAEHGVDIENLDAARTRMADVKAYVEVHIEQGPVLEDRWACGICTVTGTKGIERERLIFPGQAVARRDDADGRCAATASGAAARFALARRRRSPCAHDGVTTVGSATLWPGVVTATAGETRITLDMRHIDAGALAAMFAECVAAADGRRRGRGLHGRVRAHLPHPADAVPPAAARRRPRGRARGRGPRRRAAVAARCTTPARWPARSRR